MKRHLLLTSLVAIVATTGVAKATEITPLPTEILGGYYQLSDGSWAMNSEVLDSSTRGYKYKDANGTDVNSDSIDNAPDVQYFQYEDLSGDASSYNPESIKAIDYFAGTTVAGGESYALVTSTQSVAAQDVAAVDDAQATMGNYSYASVDTNGDPDVITYTGTKQTFTKTHILDGTYVAGTDLERTITITDGTVTGDVSAEMYKGTVAGDATVYHLVATTVDNVTTYSLATADGAGVDIVEPGALQDLLTDLSGAYVTDTTAIANFKKDTGAWAETELTAFGQAEAAYNADNQAIKDLTGLWLGYNEVKDAYDTAVTAQNNAKTAFNNDLAYQQYSIQHTAANDTPDIASDINAEAAARASGDATTLANAQAYANSLASNYDEAGAADAAKGYADEKDNVVRGEFAAADNVVREEFAAADNVVRDEFAAADNVVREEFAAADTTLQNNIDNEVARATAQEAAIRGEMAAGDALTLRNANAYTDKKVDTLEKNVSGGVAAATALSAVNVANVSKGEVSVGGGYGYYNSQSAMAFGAAMGLSDNWSVNAGAGIAQGDKTQFSIRAGTNYKFKLF